MEPAKMGSAENISTDEIIKKTPDEEIPSILGHEPDLLAAEPSVEKPEGFEHLHKDEDLVDENLKGDDGLL